MERRGVLFVVSAPSGAGKTTLCKELAARVSSLKHSISYTTRSPRPGELHGREYFFVDARYFQSLVERNEFAEWAQVYGQRYGTPRTPLIELMDEGIDVLLEIDVQGARQIKKTFEDAVYVYIFPPSIEALRLRLEQRAGDSTEEIQRRLQKVREEMWSYREYDYIVKNDDMTKAIKELEAIVLSERIKTKRVDVQWLEENFIRQKELHLRSADDQSE
jgi:guanylate kinase